MRERSGPRKPKSIIEETSVIDGNTWKGKASLIVFIVCFPSSAPFRPFLKARRVELLLSIPLPSEAHGPPSLPLAPSPRPLFHAAP